VTARGSEEKQRENCEYVLHVPLPVTAASIASLSSGALSRFLGIRKDQTNY